MIFLFCILSFALLLVVGYLCLAVVSPDQLAEHNTPLLKYSIAFGLGVGITSFTDFLSIIIMHNKSAVIIDSMLILFLFSVRFIFKRANEPVTYLRRNTTERLDKAIVIVAGLIFTISSIEYILRALEIPLGDVDAWAIWNMRARNLFLGTNWRSAFDSSFSHADYPLLLPMSIVRMLSYSGKESIVAPIAIAFLFTASTVALLYSSVSVLRNKVQGLLASCILVGIPFYSYHGASQYADVPLSFYFLLTILLLTFHDFYSGSWKLLVLAGMTASFSAWTKNEGILFVVAVLIARLIVLIGQISIKAAIKETVPYLVGSMPILAFIWQFKRSIAPPNDLVNSAGLKMTLTQLSEPARYVEVLKAIGLHMDVKWVVVAFLLVIYLAVVKTRFREQEKRLINSTALILLLMGMGYFGVYIITPHNIDWHVTTSLNRLILQLWPSVVFLYFMIVAPYNGFNHSAQSSEISRVDN
jgi:hypothetical protein